jgi:hypothetical protein
VSNEQDNQQQLHKLYQSLPQDMPPPELDARILAAAHQAAALERSRVTNLSRHRQSQYAWLKPLAYAAVLVLCLGVVLRIQIDQQTMMPQSVAPVAVEAESTNELQPVPQSVAPAAVPVIVPELSRMKSKQETSVRPDEMKASRLREQTAGANRQEDEMPAQMKKAADIQQPAALSINHAADAAVSMSAAESRPQSTADQDVEQALTAMLKLYQDKEFDQLAEQLKAFMAKYPGYVLPDELKQFAREKL